MNEGLEVGSRRGGLGMKRYKVHSFLTMDPLCTYVFDAIIISYTGSDRSLLSLTVLAL